MRHTSTAVPRLQKKTDLAASHKVLGQPPCVVEAHDLRLYGQSLRPKAQDGLTID